MRIGIYGGTFNPIHVGHMEAAKAAVKKLRLEKLYLIPTGLPPHKALGTDAPPAGKRLEMAALAAEELGGEALDLELRREGKSYTLDTLRELKKRFPKDRLFLLMGTDMFLSFQDWREPKKIAKLATLCAFSRESGDGTDEKKYLKKNLGADVELLSLPQVVEISSTQLRQDLAQGGKLAKEYLSPAVYGYILREGLYGTGADLKRLPLERLRPVALSCLNHRRIPHVLGTEQEAVRLAERWGADVDKARRAALLHDCTKKLSLEEQLAVAERFRVPLDDMERREIKLLHAKTGAGIAEAVFGTDEETTSAIRWHTTGRGNMTLLEKVIYLADYIEPNRDFPGVEELRRTCYEDLDAGLLLGLEMTIGEMESRNAPIHPKTLEARDALKGQR